MFRAALRVLRGQTLHVELRDGAVRIAIRFLASEEPR
jgi:ubiquinone biosynthesis protein UbiJ